MRRQVVREVGKVVLQGCYDVGPELKRQVQFQQITDMVACRIFYRLVSKRVWDGTSKQLKVWMLTELGYNSMVPFTIILG